MIMTDANPVSVSSSTCVDPFWAPLPQPTDLNLPYSYVLFEAVGSLFFRGQKSYGPGTLVWVLKSKGKQQKSPKYRRGGKRSGNDDCGGEEGKSKPTRADAVDNGDDDDDDGVETASGVRTELFLRARVVSDDGREDDDERRVLVRYPKGSTYRVRSSHLRPVLEADVVADRICLVVPETPDYRRAAMLHTCVGESFLEIGCDFGPCVDRVRRALTEVGGVPMDPEHDEPIKQAVGGAGATAAGENGEEGKVICLGIDKSPKSIDIALERYPETCFSLEDALTDDGTAKLRDLCRRQLVGGSPDVVAIDINGDRELPAVLRCLDNVMVPGGDAIIDWSLPRLIIVKSRMLYDEVKSRQKLGLQC